MNETVPTGDIALNPDQQYAHPFDVPQFQAYLDDQFPSYAELISSATRPELSQNPDELEQWEAERILARKERFSDEPDSTYLQRVLYEESFSVNQRPGDNDTFQGSAGFTPGGLVSHHYTSARFDKMTIADIAALPEIGEPELTAAMMKFDAPGRLIEAATVLAVIDRLTRPGGMGAPNIQLVQRYINGQVNVPAFGYEAVGYRLLRVLHETPEMLETVQDTELQQRFVNHDRNMSRAELLMHAWRRSSDALIPDGAFTPYSTPEKQLALENLLALRTHPEMQVFYRYLSPSGYLNQPLGDDKPDYLDEV